MVPPFLDSTLVLTHRESQVVPLQGSGSASGFPSPAEDYEEGRIDLNRELIRSPLSTFFMRVRGTAMRDEGIVNGDLLVIDRSLNPRAGCLVVAVFEGHFIVRRLRCGPKGQRDLQLEARDGQSRPIPLETGQGSGAELWGVVVHTVHHLNRQGDSPRRRAKLRRQEGGRMGP